MKRNALVIVLLVAFAATAFADHPKQLGIGIVGGSGYGSVATGGDIGLALKLQNMPIYWQINAHLSSGYFGLRATGDNYMYDQNLLKEGDFKLDWFLGLGGYANLPGMRVDFILKVGYFAIIAGITRDSRYLSRFSGGFYLAPKGNSKTVKSIDLRPIKTQRASEAICEQVKDLIAKGELKPGDRLPSERAMMELLQRSRPTIREALRMLENSGFIRIFAGANGAVVQEFNTSSIEQSLESMLQYKQINLEELSEYRDVTDSAIAAFAAKRRTAKDIENLQAVLIEAKKSLDDYQTFVQYDSKFHGLLAKAAKNEVAHIITLVLSRVVMGFIENKMHKLSSEERRAMCSRILKMHSNILASVVEGDPVASRKAMETHVRAFSHDLKNGI